MCAAVIFAGVLCATVTAVFAYNPAETICGAVKPQPLTSGSLTGTLKLPDTGYENKITLAKAPTVKYTVDCANKDVKSVVLLNPADGDKTEIRASTVDDCEVANHGKASAKFELKSKSGVVHCCELECYPKITASLRNCNQKGLFGC